MSAKKVTVYSSLGLGRRQSSPSPTNNDNGTGNAFGIGFISVGAARPLKTVTTFILPCIGLMLILAILASVLTWLHKRRQRRIRSEFINGRVGPLYQERPTMHSVFVKDWDVEAAMEKAEYRWCDIQPLSTTVSRSSSDSTSRVDPMSEKPASIASGFSGSSARRREKEDVFDTLPGLESGATHDQAATAIVAVMIAMPQPPSARTSKSEQSMSGMGHHDMETQVPEVVIGYMEAVWRPGWQVAIPSDDLQSSLQTYTQ